jgi:hypothetical protein
MSSGKHSFDLRAAEVYHSRVCRNTQVLTMLHNAYVAEVPVQDHAMSVMRLRDHVTVTASTQPAIDPRPLEWPQQDVATRGLDLGLDPEFAAVVHDIDVWDSAAHSALDALVVRTVRH